MIKAVLILVLLAVGCHSQLAVISCNGFSESIFTVQSVVVSGFNTDTTTLVLETQSPGMSMTIQYAGTGFASVNAFQGAVTFDRVVEFKDTGAAGYDGEAIVKETALDFTFNPPADCTTNGPTAMNFTASSGGIPWFTLQCYVVKAKRNVGSVEIVPTQTKCDVIIQNYPYSSPDNHIALGGSYWYQSVVVNAGTGPLVGLTGVAVAIGDGEQSIAFDWVTTAATLNGNVDVIFTQPNGVSGGLGLSGYDGSESLFFTFSQAGSSFINWDPSFGLVEGTGNIGAPVAAPSKSSATSVAGSAVALASVTALTLF